MRPTVVLVIMLAMACKSEDRAPRSEPPPPADDAGVRPIRTPRIELARPTSYGDLDKAEIIKVITAAEPQLLACYRTALARKPDLAGTIDAQFFIDPAGHVPNSSASGVEPGLSACVKDLIATLGFPKPRGGGGVQVNFPITMRP